MTQAEERKTVTIGDRSVELGSLSGFKVMRSGTILGRIIKQVTGISDEIQGFVAEYREANVEKTSRAMFEFRAASQHANAITAMQAEVRSEHPGWEEADVRQEAEMRVGPAVSVSDEAWAACENVMEIHRSPSGFEIFAFVLPHVLERAEEEVVKLLALMIAPDGEIREAKRSGRYEEFLAEKGEDLLFDAEIDELFEIATVTAEVLEGKLAGKLQRLQTAVSRLMGASGLTEEPETTPTSGVSSNGTSSTDSPKPTDGTQRPVSSAPGRTSTASSSE